MKFILLLIPVIFICNTASAQYYYNDVLGNQKTNEEFAKIKEAGFHKVILKSFEDNDQPSEGFFCEKNINKDYSQSDMLSRSYITGESEIKSFYADNKIVKSINNTEHITNTTSFIYNDAGLLAEVNISTFGNADSSTFTESRKYIYDAAGKPSKMVRYKNGRQVSEIVFLKDEHGNVIEENPGNSITDKKYYYYYENNRLTDIVHYNEIAKKLLPDYMFLYTTFSLPSQMISVDESGRNYFIWKYAYDANGLPEIQKCYSKEKRLLGTIQYEYE